MKRLNALACLVMRVVALGGVLWLAAPTLLAADVIFLDFAGINDNGSLEAEQKTILKDKLKADIQRNFDSAVGAGKFVITSDPTQRAGAARQVHFVDKDGYYVDASGATKQAYGIWERGKDVFVAVREFTVKHAEDYEGRGKLDKLANGMGLVAAHEVGHSYSIGHNKKAGDPSKMIEGGLVKSKDIATARWEFDKHSQTNLAKRLGKQPSKTATDYFDACCAVLETRFYESPRFENDLFEYGYFDALFAFNGPLARDFDLGWLGDDTDAGLLDGNIHYDFIYKTSMQGTDDDADLLSFFADAHARVQFVLQGVEGTPFEGHWFLMNEGVFTPLDAALNPRGEPIFRAFTLGWDVDGRPGLDVSITLNANGVHGDAGTDLNGWSLATVSEPASLGLVVMGLLALALRGVRRTAPRVPGLLVLAVLGALPVAAFAQPTDTVLVYNGARTGYDAAAEGLAWQQAGFLRADGAPMARDANGNIVDERGAIVGNRIPATGRVIGWRNAARDITIVDINIGTFAQAYGLVTDTGTITVSKHGIYRDANGNGRPDAGDSLGGALQLDNGTPYTGFGTGTGVPGGRPYALPARDRTTITLNLDCCWSANDPDGAGATYPQTSVTESATTVRGIAQAAGSAGESQAGAVARPRYTLPRGVTEAQVNAAIAAAFTALAIRNTDAARPGAFATIGDWINSLPFADQLRRVRALLPTVVVGGHTITLNWAVVYESGVGPGGSNLDFPQALDTMRGGTIIHQTPSHSGLTGQVFLESFTDADEFTDWEALQLTRLGDLPAHAPPGLSLFTGIYGLTAVDGLLEALSGTFLLDTLAGFAPDTLHLYRLLSGDWTPLRSNEFIDRDAGLVSADFAAVDLAGYESVVVAGFAAIPEPGTLALLGAALLSACWRSGQRTLTYNV